VVFEKEYSMRCSSAEWIDTNGCALRYWHRGVGRQNEETVGFPELTVQFSVWKATGKDSSEACAIAGQNRAVYSVFPSGLMSHTNLAQFNWDYTAPFSDWTILQGCWRRIKSSGTGPCRLVISYIRFGRDFCFHLQSNLVIDNFDGGGNKVLQNVEALQPILWHIIPEYWSLLKIWFHTIFKNIFITEDLTQRNVIRFKYLFQCLLCTCVTHCKCGQTLLHFILYSAFH
jgi:hypothetical protein